jgi:hypothetical protein
LADRFGDQYAPFLSRGCERFVEALEPGDVG